MEEKMGKIKRNNGELQEQIKIIERDLAQLEENAQKWDMALERVKNEEVVDITNLYNKYNEIIEKNYEIWIQNQIQKLVNIRNKNYNMQKIRPINLIGNWKTIKVNPLL